MATVEEVMQVLVNEHITFYAYLDEDGKPWWIASKIMEDNVVEGRRQRTSEQALSALVRELTK